VPYRWLFPSIVLFCAIGVYSTNNNVFDIWLVAIMGVVGYAFIKLGCEPAPLLLGFILGPMMEENLRRRLLLSRGDWSVLVTRPLSAGLLAAALAAGDHRGAAVDQEEARGSLRRGLARSSRSRSKMGARGAPIFVWAQSPHVERRGWRWPSAAPSPSAARRSSSSSPIATAWTR
jgi:hypothetical protein